MFIARNTPAFVGCYLLMMVPTYVLPYFGSNALVVNALSAAFGVGPTPQWWAHIWCLAMLTLLAWVRGGAIGKGFLPVFPVIAGIFDMTPGFNVIPLVPTVMHIIGVVIGAMSTPSDGLPEFAGFQKAKLLATVTTIIAVGGGILFIGATAYKAKQAPQIFKGTPFPTATKNASSPAASTQIEHPASIATAAQPLTNLPPNKAASASKAPDNFSVGKIPANPAKTEPKSAEKPVVRYIHMDD